jgi:hypothetical protein
MTLSFLRSGYFTSREAMTPIGAGEADAEESSSE